MSLYIISVTAQACSTLAMPKRVSTALQLMLPITSTSHDWIANDPSSDIIWKEIKQKSNLFEKPWRRPAVRLKILHLNMLHDVFEGAWIKIKISWEFRKWPGLIYRSHDKISHYAEMLICRTWQLIAVDVAAPIRKLWELKCWVTNLITEFHVSV